MSLVTGSKFGVMRWSRHTVNSASRRNHARIWSREESGLLCCLQNARLWGGLPSLLVDD
jgi:hypothetical protein